MFAVPKTHQKVEIRQNSELEGKIGPENLDFGQEFGWYLGSRGLKGAFLWQKYQCVRDVRVFVFEMFLKPPMQLQTTRSRRLLNGF